MGSPMKAVGGACISPAQAAKKLGSSQKAAARLLKATPISQARSQELTPTRQGAAARQPVAQKLEQPNGNLSGEQTIHAKEKPVQIATEERVARIATEAPQVLSHPRGEEALVRLTAETSLVNTVTEGGFKEVIPVDGSVVSTLGRKTKEVALEDITNKPDVGKENVTPGSLGLKEEAQLAGSAAEAEAEAEADADAAASDTNHVYAYPLSPPGPKEAPPAPLHDSINPCYEAEYYGRENSDPNDIGLLM